MQDLDVFGLEGLFLFYTLLRVSKQGIISFVCLTLIIVDLEVVIKEFLSPADLSRAQTHRVHELAKVFVIDKYEHLMLGVFWIVSPGLENFNNG